MTFDPLIRSLGAYFDWAPPWVFSLVLIALALAVSQVLYGLAVRIIRRRLGEEDSFWRPLLLRTRGPARMGLCIIAVAWAIEAAPLPAELSSLAQHALLIAFIVLLGWAAMTALDIAATLYLRQYDVAATDNLLARKHYTQVRVLRRAAATLVVLLTAAFALMTVPGVRQLGVSLLAAGGAAGIIVGLALQPVLSNLLAGVQIALTQPIRIDDAVVVEGEWGKVEEITTTYVVIRIWDLRRLIVPLKYFMERPFQNWTRESANLLGAVILHLDYSVPVEAIREKLKEILDASPLWDGDVSGVQVTNASERSMEIRILASASNSANAWDLRCEVREKMIAWLNEGYPHALPRERIDLSQAEVDGASESRSRPREQRVQ